jgi:DNA-binding beta-propeller fold protein YncE
VRRAVELIDPETYQVVRRLQVGNAPRQIVPSWDLKTLWISDGGGTLVPMDARTGHRGPPVAVASPHDLYFTPDGRTALVMTGTLRRIDFRDPRTMRLRHALPVPCDGVGHADFSAAGDELVVTCERSGRLVRVDPRRRTVTGVLPLHRRAAPKDVRLSPDGTVFYVSDPVAEGVWVVDAERFGKLGFIRTGPGAGGLTPSRDGTVLYVSGRRTITLIDFASRRVVGRWRLPHAGSAGMGGVSADGKVLWLPGRSAGLVYAIATDTGRQVHAIRAGTGAAGLSVFPQPGRFSLGHTGNYR